MSAKCSQCNNSALYNVEGNLLCLNCFTIYQNNTYRSINYLANEANFALDFIDSIIGIPTNTPRYKPIPLNPIIHNAPIVFNNIKVDNSFVGSINTGNIHRIDIAIDHMKSPEDGELVKGLKDFTEAILTSNETTIELKNQLVEQISFISEEILKIPEKKQKSIVKTIMANVKASIILIDPLLKIWDKIEPILKTIF